MNPLIEIPASCPYALAPLNVGDDDAPIFTVMDQPYPILSSTR